ncbi:hypothetical protein F2Q70_00013345 [Brassica cretica]|uniref:Uncharacterized protein n=1 Tax=Brassica cretica TaxID=69181 RepID=A0A8S9LY05_BRACR|nr:hypothetical protein F2Q70_00013345 [Brassica cretica]
MFFPLPRPLLILLCQYVKTLVSVFSSQIWDAGDVFCLTVVFFRNGDEDESSSLLRLDFDGVSVNASSGGVIRSSPTSCLESLAWWCVELSTLRRHQLLQTEDDASTASTNLSRFRINEIVESSVPKKKGRLVGLGRRTRSVHPSSAPPPFVDPEVLTAQLKDKDDRIFLLETQMTAQQTDYEA